jgi:hypothetical protein
VLDLLRICCDPLPMQTTQCEECRSRFHSGCLANWLATGTSNCPMCRQDSLPLHLLRDENEEQMQQMTTPEQIIVPLSQREQFSAHVRTFLRGLRRQGFQRERR